VSSRTEPYNAYAPIEVTKVSRNRTPMMRAARRVELEDDGDMASNPFW
jgi:hypothetical protein